MESLTMNLTKNDIIIKEGVPDRISKKDGLADTGAKETTKEAAAAADYVSLETDARLHVTVLTKNQCHFVVTEQVNLLFF